MRSAARKRASRSRRASSVCPRSPRGSARWSAGSTKTPRAASSERSCSCSTGSDTSRGARSARCRATRGDHALVCERCMPSVVPRCSLCGEAAPSLGVDDEGYRHHAFHHLCAACRARVLRSGEARSRRAAVTSRRLETLLSRHAGLHVGRARASSRLRARRDRWSGGVGHAEGTRHAKARWSDSSCAWGLPAHVPLEAVAWVSALRVSPVGSPERVIDRGAWLRAGFRHLGNADLLHVLDVMLDAADRAERAMR
jgi:hypothetical protein